MRAVMMCDIGRWRARTHPSRAGRGPALAAWSAHGAGHANRFRRRAPKTNNLSDRTTVAVCGTEPPGRNTDPRIVTHQSLAKHKSGAENVWLTLEGNMPKAQRGVVYYFSCSAYKGP